MEIILSSNELLRSSKLVDLCSPTAAAPLLVYMVAETEPMKLLDVVVAVSFSNLVTIRVISKTTSHYALSPFPFLFPSFAVFIKIQIKPFFTVDGKLSSYRNLYIITRRFLLHSRCILNPIIILKKYKTTLQTRL